MKSKFICFIMCMLFVRVASADIVVDNTNSSVDENLSLEQIMEKQRTIKTLENDIVSLDLQLENCKKKKKGWVAATVAGGVGVVGTGIGAIVQANKISDKKRELSEKQIELNNMGK